MKTYNSTFKFLLKHWLIIIICALACGSGLYFEKTIVNQSVPKTGSIVITKVVRFDAENRTGLDIHDENNQVVANLVTIKSILGMWSNAETFLNNTEGIYNYVKLDAAWNNLSRSEKIEWFYKHFYVTVLGNNNYEFVLKFTEADSKDSEYLKENGANLLNEYVAFAVKACNEISPIYNVEVKSEYSMFDTKQDVNPKMIPIKYGIMGFILGGFVSCAILCMYSMKIKE